MIPILIRSVAYISIIVCLLIPTIAQSRSSRRKLVIVMDNPRIAYDLENQTSGRTNTNEIRDALGGINKLKVIEVETSQQWKGEKQLKSKNPDLIILHLSAFVGSMGTADDAASMRLLSFFRAMEDSNAQFLIYTRSPFFEETAAQQSWVKQMERRAPALRKRLRVFRFNEDKGFRDPRVRLDLQIEVRNILDIF